MAVRSIIDIEVNDQAFSRFSAAFKQYQSLLKQTPQSWQQAQAGIDGSRKSFQALVTASAAQQAQARAIAAAQREATRQLDTQSRTWRDIGRSTKTVATQIADMTKSLLRWASLTGVFSGLIGAGGLFGIERLAHSASGMRTSSMGLGVSPGQQGAFNLNYGRMLPNSGGLLSAVNAGLTDPRQSASLMAAGLTPGDIRGRNTAEVAVTLVDKLKQLADSTERNMLGGVHQARGLDKFITLEDFQRLKDTPAGEIGGMRRKFLQDSKTLDLTKDQQTAWQQLSIQLHRVAEQIEVSLMRALVRLAPALEKLSDGFGKMVRDLLESKTLDLAISGLVKGLDWLGTKFSDPKFQQSVEDFTVKVGQFAKDVVKLVETTGSFIHWLTNGSKDRAPSGPLGPAGPRMGSPQYLRDHAKEFWEFLKRKFDTDTSGARELHPTGGVTSFRDMIRQTVYRGAGASPPGQPSGGTGLLPSTGGRGSAAFHDLEHREGLPSGLLDAVWNQESRRGRNMGPSSAGAMGHFQFMPGTARRFGLADPNDLGQSSDAASRYLGILLKRYGGDVAKAAAGYNWGEGNLDRAIRKYGDSWRDHAPRETQGYVKSILEQLGMGGGRQPQQSRGGGQWAVNIFNNTGGNAIVTAAQLPA